MSLFLGPKGEVYGPFLEDFRPGRKYYDDSNDTVSEGTIEWGIITGLLTGGIKQAGKALASGIASTLAPAIPEASNINPNKINHIFNNAEHNLKPLLDSFNNNIQNTFTAVQNAVQQVVNANGLSKTFKASENPITVNVNGFINQVGEK